MVSTSTARVQGVARGGAFALCGAIVSAVAGFVLTVVLGRTLGAEGVGVVLQAIAAFTIAMSVGRAGLDTTAVWLLPRLVDGATGDARSALNGLLGLSSAFGLATAVGLWLVAPSFAESSPELVDVLRLMAWALPFATFMTVALSATRGLGGVRPYVLVGNIAVPGSRPLMVWGATMVGGGAVAAGFAWVLPFPVAVLVCSVVLVRLIRRVEPHSNRGLPSRELLGRIRRYALPRSVASILEQALQWLDVLIVGLLAGPVVAGIYGAATRLVGAGMVLSSALRIVVAPHYSRLLGRRLVADVQSLYTTTTTWIVFFSAPVFLTFAVFGGTVLGIFGPEFRPGATALLLLATGLVLVLLAGNVQSVLLMSGYSGRAAMNKVIAVVVNVVGIFALVPSFGIEGAAIAWSLAMLVDTALAAWQVQRLVGVTVMPGRVLLGVGTALGAFGLPALVARTVFGDTWAGLLAGVCVGGVVWCLTGLLLRRHLLFDAIGLVIRRSRYSEREGT